MEDVSRSIHGTTNNHRPAWSRKQKRWYHRIQSLLFFWESQGYQVHWVTLSTAEGGDGSKLTYNHKRLRQRIKKRLGYKQIQYYQIKTAEGNGVLHVFLVWRPAAGDQARRFWIDQRWLSDQWQSIHGAAIVWIKAYNPGKKSRNRLSRYVISQYVQNQCGYVNMSWSWKRSLGFPIGAVWGVLRKQWQKKNSLRIMNMQPELPMLILIRTWEELLAGQAILMGDRVVQLIVGRGLVQTTLWAN